MISKEDYISTLKSVSTNMIIPFIVNDLNSKIWGIQINNTSIAFEVKDSRPDATEQITRCTSIIEEHVNEIRNMLVAFLEFSEAQSRSEN